MAIVQRWINVLCIEFTCVLFSCSCTLPKERNVLPPQDDTGKMSIECVNLNNGRSTWLSSSNPRTWLWLIVRHLVARALKMCPPYLAGQKYWMEHVIIRLWKYVLAGLKTYLTSTKQQKWAQENRHKSQLLPTSCWRLFLIPLCNCFTNAAREQCANNSSSLPLWNLRRWCLTLFSHLPMLEECCFPYLSAHFAYSSVCLSTIEALWILHFGTQTSTFVVHFHQGFACSRTIVFVFFCIAKTQLLWLQCYSICLCGTHPPLPPCHFWADDAIRKFFFSPKIIFRNICLHFWKSKSLSFFATFIWLRGSMRCEKTHNVSIRISKKLTSFNHSWGPFLNVTLHNMVVVQNPDASFVSQRPETKCGPKILCVTHFLNPARIIRQQVIPHEASREQIWGWNCVVLLDFCETFLFLIRILCFPTPDSPAERL